VRLELLVFLHQPGDFLAELERYGGAATTSIGGAPPAAAPRGGAASGLSDRTMLAARLAALNEGFFRSSSCTASALDAAGARDAVRLPKMEASISALI